MTNAVRLAAAALIVAFLLGGQIAVRAQTASFDDTAKFLAGLRPAVGSPIAAMTGDRYWQVHASRFAAAWSDLETRQLSKIRQWVRRHLPPPKPVAFYMFSGPDFVFADAFFPDASTYVLSGLEPVGPVPDVTRLHRASLAGALAHLQGTLTTVLRYSFFRTRDMKADLRGGGFTGTLPILYVFLARTGKTIKDVAFIDLQSDGTVRPYDRAGARSAPTAVKIVFSDGPGGADKTLYYFSTNLANGGFDKTGFREFCAGLSPGDSLVKSASYLMHNAHFSQVREFLLQNSAVMIQDPSGIPVKYYPEAEWELHPFGRYLGPISEFPGRFDRAAANLFNSGRAKPVDFGIGYRWRPHETSILLAVRKDAAARPAGGPRPR